MTLSNTQIEALFLFVEKKQVRWYDLQTELVDHLANKIEEELAVNPTYNFDFALQKVYASFGIFGFARIVREKEEQVRKQNNKLWLQEFKNQFVWPNLVRSIALFFIVKILMDFITPEYFILLGFGTIVLHFVAQVVVTNKQKKSKKKLLITQYQLLPGLLGFSYYHIFFNCFNFGDTEIMNTPKYYAIFIVIYLTTLSYYVSSKVASNIYAKAKKLYPEAFKIAH